MHYSISEASGHLRVVVENKKGVAGKVNIKTEDAEAKSGHDYVHIDKNIEFKNGESTNFVDIQIIDDDNWEPDRDFFV